MANLQKTVEIIFGGKNELTGIIEDIEKDFKSLEKSVDNVTTPLAAVGKSIVALDAALVAMAVGGIAYTIKAAGEFEESFDRVALRITASSAEIGRFKGDVLTYAADSSRSLTEINAALTEAIQKGTKYTDAINELGIAEHLAVATHSDLKSSTVLLSTVMNSYGASISEATHYGDIFTQGIKMGAGEIPILAEELGKISGIAHAMGIPIETLTAAIAALGSYGIDSGTALGGLKFMLSNLLNPSKEATEEAGRLGIQFNATAVKTKGLAEVMKEAYVATGGNAEAMKVLFGSVRGLNVAYDLAGDSQGHFRDNLLAMKSATGVMQTEYDKFVDDMGNVNQRLKNSFEITLITIGDKLMPEYAKIAASLGDLMKGVKVGIDAGAFNELFSVLDAAGAAIAKWIEQVGKAFPEALKNLDFSALAESLKTFGAAFAKAFSLDNINPETLAHAMQTVVDSLSSLIEVTKGMGAVFTPLIRTAEGLVEGFNKLDDATKQMFGTIVANSLVYKLFGPIGIAMKYLGEDSETMSRVINTAFTSLDNGINAVKVAVLSLAVVFAHASQDMAELLDYIPGLDMSADLKRTGDRVNELDGLLAKANLDLIVSSDKVVAAFLGTDKAVTSSKSKTDEYINSAKSIPESVTTEVDLRHKAALEAAEALKKSLGEIPEKKYVGVQVLDDGSTIQKVAGLIRQTFPEGEVLVTNVGVRTDEVNLSGISAKIEKAIPAKKEIDAQVKIDEAKLKAQSDIIQKAIEWKAKVDIANIEAAAATIKGIFTNLDTRITSTATVIGTILSSLSNADLASGVKNTLADMLQDEAAARKVALEQSAKLTEQQIALNKLKLSSLERGDSMIKISADGLKPQLEMILWEILEAIQIRANASGAEFLLGVT